MKEKGFTLIEMVVSLAVVAILAGIATPLIYQQITSDRTEETRAKMKMIYQAMRGNPESGTYGYVGDIGSLPAGLNDLLAQPAGVSSYATYKNGVGYGWRGPYLNTQDNGIVDGWGHEYRYAQPPDGVGQIRSAGADGIFGNADDILFPQNPVQIYGTLLVSTYVNGIPNPATTTVEIFYPQNGQEVTPTNLKLWTKQDNQDPTVWNGFTFSVVHGIRVIRLAYGPNPLKLVNVKVVANKQVNQPVVSVSDLPVRP